VKISNEAVPLAFWIAATVPPHPAPAIVGAVTEANRLVKETADMFVSVVGPEKLPFSAPPPFKFAALETVTGFVFTVTPPVNVSVPLWVLFPVKA